MNNYLLLKVDVDKHPRVDELTGRYHIRGVPTLIILDGSGQEVDRIAGFLEPEKFVIRIKSRLGSTI